MGIILNAALMISLVNLMFGVVLWYRVRKLYRYPNALGFPVFGNLYYFYRTLFLIDMHSVYNYAVSLARKHEVEEFGFHWMFGSLVVAVMSPDFAKKLSLHPNLTDKPKLNYGGMRSCLGGPFSKMHTDDEWRLMRKDYNNALKKSCVENDYYNNFIRGANEMIDTILASPSSDLDLHDLFIGFSLDISMKSLYGFETSLVYHPDVSKIFKTMNEFSSFAGANAMSTRVIFFLLQPIFDFILGKKVVELRKLVVEEANKKLILNQSPPAELPLSGLVASRHKKNNKSGKILNELTELLLTSGHTTSSTLANIVYILATLPDMQERAWQEQNEIFGDDKREPTIDDLNQMQFLERFIKESLRFIGPTFITKKASADIILDEVTIPRNTIVAFPLRHMRFHPKYWKDPNVFDPDRFLEERDSSKYFNTTFGIGIRYCPGIYYATTLMKIALSKIIRRIKLRPVEKDFRFEDIKFKYLLFAEVENPPKLQVEERV